MRKTITEVFKEAYQTEPTCLDESMTLSYHFDDKNISLHENKKLDIYCVTVQKFGVTQGGSDLMDWGYPVRFEVNSEELLNMRGTTSLRITDEKLISTQIWHHRLIGKKLPDGRVVPRKATDIPWSKGKVEIESEPIQHIVEET